MNRDDMNPQDTDPQDTDPQDIDSYPATALQYVVFDFETITYAGQPPEPVELGAVCVPSGMRMDSSSERVWLLEPPAHAPMTAARAAEMGLRATDFAGAPGVDAALRQFDAQFGTPFHVMVAHNAPYDLSILKRYSQWCPRILKHPFLDTVRLAKHLLPTLHSFGLDALAHHFELDIPVDRHRSLPDVRLTGQVFTRLLHLWTATRRDHRFHVLQGTAGIRAEPPSIQASLFE